MLGLLPDYLTVNGVDYDINTDFRLVLLIITAFNDNSLTQADKLRVMLENLYCDFNSIPAADLEAAIKQAVKFIDMTDDNSPPPSSEPQLRLMDWERDEQEIFGAVNKVAGYEVRSVRYLHWWSFLGLYNEVGESRFTSIVTIRKKLQTGEKLLKHEQEFYENNPAKIELLTAEEQADEQAYKDLLRERYGLDYD